MLETYLRPRYQQYLVDPIAVHFKHIVPTHITYLAGLTGIMLIPLLMLNHNYLAVMFLCISGYLDTLDGTIARMANRTSDRGTLLDIVSDRVVEFAIIFGLFMVDYESRGLLTIAMLGSCYFCVTTFLVVGIFTPNDSSKGFYYSPGLIERAEAFIFFAVMILLPTCFAFIASLFVALVLLTSYLRLKQFMDFHIHHLATNQL